MGVCSSKQQAPGSRAATPQTANGASEAAAMPSTPSPDVQPEGEPHHHTYNAAEKPHKSAMRPSMDERKSDAYSRRSSTGASTVGFAVSMDAPEAELKRTASHNFDGADSISLKKIVDMFYDSVLADAQLGPYFEGIDMAKLKKHQVRFMGLAFGGKELVFEEDPTLNLRKVHYRLIKDKGLNLAHWELFVGKFGEVLDALEKEIPGGTRDAAMASIRATKHYFVPIGEETEFTNASIAALPEEPLPQ